MSLPASVTHDPVNARKAHRRKPVGTIKRQSLGVLESHIQLPPLLASRLVSFSSTGIPSR
jgi:hypothetical protein|nr:MAG TPA: hypothetical protein [Caudoviricetes sp.]